MTYLSNKVQNIKAIMVANLPERWKKVNEGLRTSVDFDIGTSQLVWCFSQCLFKDLGHQHYLTARWSYVGVSGYPGSLHGPFNYDTNIVSNQGTILCQYREEALMQKNFQTPCWAQASFLPDLRQAVIPKGLSVRLCWRQESSLCSGKEWLSEE